MTDEQFARYAERIEPIREAHRQRLYALEQEAADGIARDLDGLRGVVSSSPIAFIEGRWLAWLDAAIVRLNEQYQRDSARIAQEVSRA